MGSAAGKQERLRIAYVVSRFPTLSETFIVEELRELKRRGVEPHIFSLKPPKTRGPVSVSAAELLENARYAGWLFDVEVIRANLRSARRNPAKYISVLWRQARGLIGQPVELVKTLAVWPKTVLFAEEASRTGCARVHAHFSNVPAAAARWMAELAGLKFSFTAHGSDIYQYPPRISSTEYLRRDRQ